MSEMLPTAPLLAALDELQAGRGAEGEALVQQAVREAESRHGASSFEHAAALFDLGRFYTAIGDYRRSADAIRLAAEVDLPGERGRRDRLTYLMNLGEMLKFAGDLESAERVLVDGLDRRRAFYGPEHSGYAFGQEVLAEVVWRRGRPDEALDLIEQAVRILWNDGNPQVFSALALRAFIRHTAGRGDGAFDDLPALDEANVDAIVANLMFRSKHVPEKGTCLAVLRDLYRWVERQRGEADASLIPILAEIADGERQQGDHERRRATLGDLVALCRKNGDTNQAIKALQSLAMAHDAVGRSDDAEHAYRLAVDSAREYGDRERLSGVYRNFGLFLKDQRRTVEAEAWLRDAVIEGRAAHDPSTLGRALTALGLLVQHVGRLDEARSLLEEALDTLPRSHPDLLYARSHLDAIESGASCGCGDMGRSVSETLRALVLPSLPADLLDDLQVEPGGGIRVDLARAPTPEEQELLQRVIGHAIRELRDGIDRSGYS